MKKNKLFLHIALATCLASQAIAQDITTRSDVSIVNERTVNTNALDYSPTFFEDGIVFISNKKALEGKDAENNFDKELSQNVFSIVIGKRGATGRLIKPEIFAEELVTPFHEGPMSFDKTAETIFFSRNNSENGKLIEVKNSIKPIPYAFQQIYIARKERGKWVGITKLPFNIAEYSFQHPSLSMDGRTLYFSSNRPGGFGGFDIWMCKRIGDEWGEPVNAGAKVNTDKREAFPFIHADNTLFFASDGRAGAGNLDIFYAKGDRKGNFQEAKNIGRPINGEGDDFGLILDSDRKNGYFTSNRAGGLGQDDIYSFSTPNTLPDAPGVLAARKATICIIDRATGDVVSDATVKYTNITEFTVANMLVDDNGGVVSMVSTDNKDIVEMVKENPSQTLTSDKRCKAPFMVSAGDYLVSVSKEGYLPRQVMLKTEDTKEEYEVLIDKGEGEAIEGLVTTDNGKPIPGATVTLKDDETGEIQTIATDPEGKYKYVPKPNKTYTVTTTKPNHLPQTTKYKKGDAPLKMQMQALESRYATGQVLELANVYYNFNDASLRPDALRDLKVLLQVMRTYPEIEIELASHTDSRSSFEYNNDLSQRRANSVVRYLIDNGVSSGRLRAKGYGENELRNQCADGVYCTEEEHQRNRRTEIRITRGANDAQVRVIDNLPEVIDPKPGVSLSGSQYANTDKNNGMNYTNDNSNVSAASITYDRQSKTMGEFIVVAASYTKKENATEEVQKLARLGYLTADVEYASDIKYYRVVVSQHPDLYSAKAMVKELKEKGIEDPFVLRK